MDFEPLSFDRIGNQLSVSSRDHQSRGNRKEVPFGSRKGQPSDPNA